ncbi:menaquinone-dependent protoporphyrinogen IX dehydrogenase [Shewanella intestini]|uniref:Protoporphyrinogen IX dehydrogenase [quinone] n=1 Tax=Shewanella intestini TaxID=2017544 RepID=A0ABS5I624_9GAMM|nr:MULTISPECIES: menaquinone-dependent protoporphyrinogen IX dehydrogenase [Shewanella]MBR9728845.1 menaquinone-dependent protoporphyrinogen IX dehydrogenase [Shewanella intestini]MRG37089.1 menaquinone-dependent protoporphyrinogen IX dehydrogenase [Shewanella sp. XMDDZSB0408]
MANILVVYYSRGGHTAKISNAIAQKIVAIGNSCDVINLNDTQQPIDWAQYDAVALGACVLYGSYHKSVFEFCRQHHQDLAALPNSFFCVNVVARKPEKRIPENNKYLQKFLALSDWKPQDVKIIAGKVDYPSWNWYDSLAIKLIMKITDGPTDSKAVIDYTDWNDVDVYAEHVARLAQA